MASAPPEEYLYPALPTQYEDMEEKNAFTYRLTVVRELQEKLEKEIEFREGLFKKYNRAVNVTDGVDSILLTVSVTTGGVGIAAMTSVIGSPVGLPMEIAAVAIGAIGFGITFLRRKLTMKAKKHDEVRILAQSKLNTISDYVSKSLIDGKIDETEFNLIVTEVEKYRSLKEAIRSKTKKAGKIDEQEKKQLIQQGKEEILKKIKAVGSSQ